MTVRDEPESAGTAAEHPLGEGVVREVVYHDETGVVLSEVLAWTESESGLHVIRSTEFDLIAMDEDERRAIDQFVDEAFELCFALLDLNRTGTATEHEVETYRTLSDRILEVYEKQDEMERRARPPLVAFPRLRRGDPHRRGKLGGSASSPAKQAQPSPA